MKQFSEFGITPTIESFVGDKIKMDRLLNREITVHDYRIEESKFKEKGNGKCLYLQIELNGEKHVVFTGSAYLMDMIEKVAEADFPFKTKILKQNDHLEFT